MLENKRLISSRESEEFVKTQEKIQMGVYQRGGVMRSVYKMLAVLVVVSMICSSGHAFAASIGEQEIDITVSEVFVSRYIWRGQDLYGQNDGAHQPSIDFVAPEALFGADVGLNIWASFPFASGHEAGEEFDYTFSLSRDIAEGVNASVGYTYFDFPNLGSSVADVHEPWISVSVDTIPFLPVDISFSTFAGYDQAAESGGPEDGWYFSYGFGYDVPLPKIRFTQEGQALSLGVTMWGTDGVAGLEPNMLYATELSASMSYSFDEISFGPSINYTINHEDKINSGDNEFWAGVEFSYSF